MRLKQKGDLFASYQRYEAVQAYLINLEKKFPRLVRTEVIGRSFEQRDIRVIRISDGGPKPAMKRSVVFVEAGCHAREWLTVAMALYCIQQLVERHEENARILKRLDWVILPLMNPDGYEYSHEKNKNWRKTRRPNAGSAFRGTDCNRNFDISWTAACRRPGRCNFRGEEPFSESETSSVRDYLISLRPTVKFYLALHSHAKAILYPFACRSKLPETWRKLHALAKVGHDAIISATGKRYVYGSTASTFRRLIGGSSCDYAYSVERIPFVITLELSGGSFHPPADRIRELVQEGWIGIREMALHAARN